MQGKQWKQALQTPSSKDALDCTLVLDLLSRQSLKAPTWKFPEKLWLSPVARWESVNPLPVCSPIGERAWSCFPAMRQGRRRLASVLATPSGLWPCPAMYVIGRKLTALSP